jgi:hypothetical protein
VTPGTPTGTTGTTSASPDSSVRAIQSCLRSAGFTTKPADRISHETTAFKAVAKDGVEFAVDEWGSAAAATSWVTSARPTLYDRFGTFTVGPGGFAQGDSRIAEFAQVENCVRRVAG